MLPSSFGVQPMPVDEPVEVHDHAGLVAVDVAVEHAGRIGLGLQQRPDGAVELRVHEQHVLAVIDRVEHDPRAVLDRAGDLENDVDAVRPRT